jgi:hypothetical protein
MFLCSLLCVVVEQVSQTKGHIRQHLVSQISKAADLALTEGDFICVEYVEEHPSVLMNPGEMRRRHMEQPLRRSTAHYVASCPCPC